MQNKVLSLSEAILEGAKLHPQGDPNHYFTWEVEGDGTLVCIGSDTLGAVCEAVIGNVHHDEDYIYQRIHEWYGHARETVQVLHPNRSGQLISQEEAIYELQKMGWSCEDIA